MNILSMRATGHHDVIYVVATTMSGTEAALRFALSMARHRGACLVLVVPETAYHLARTEGAPLPKSWLVARYKRLARTLDDRIQVLSCVSNSDIAAACQLTPPCAATVVGGRHRWWWPYPEERVAAALRRSGRHVAYIPETADIRRLLLRFDMTG